MLLKVSKIQKELLLVAAQRKDRCIATPRTLASPGVSAAISDLIARGFIAEVAAKNNAFVWRRDDNQGTAYGLKLTTAGRKLAAALAIPPDAAEVGEQADVAHNFKAVGQILKARTRKAIDSEGAAHVVEPGNQGLRDTKATKPHNVFSAADMSAPLKSTRASTLIELLSDGSGKSVSELAAAMNWLPHTTRAALTGLRKRGVPLLRERAEGAAVSVYRIESARPDRSPAASDGARLRPLG